MLSEISHLLPTFVCSAHAIIEKFSQFLGAKVPLELAHVKKKEWNRKFWNSVGLLLWYQMTYNVAR